MDPQMNNLLKWSIENSNASKSTNGETDNTPRPNRPLDADALQSLFGGPSDADLMKESMAAILSPNIILENKLVAFDNFEQLIETIDNANNMEPLGLWTPLVGLLGSEEKELRRMAAWCIGTSVQNNIKGQERLLVLGAIPNLARLTLSDPDEGVRRKAIYALSSEVRNYQPATDVFMEALPEELNMGKANASDMDRLDEIMEKLREQSKHKASL